MPYSEGRLTLGDFGRCIPKRRLLQCSSRGGLAALAHRFEYSSSYWGMTLYRTAKHFCTRIHRSVRKLSVCGLGLGLVLAVGCDEPKRRILTHTPMGEMVAYVETSEPIQPLLPGVGGLDGKARLGKLLFHDPRLSHDNTISCSSCHDVARGGDDGRRFSIGIDGAVGSINSPSVLNASLNLLSSGTVAPVISTRKWPARSMPAMKWAVHGRK